MALITRLSRLFRADAHAVLDRIEEPDLLLRQAVREVEAAIGRDEQRIRLLGHEDRQIRTRIEDAAQTLRRLDEELDVCFDAGKEDLARTLVRRRLEAERLRDALARRGEETASALEQLRRSTEENRSQLDSMRQKVELLANEDESREPTAQWSQPDLSVRDEDVEIAFLREKQRRQSS